MTKRELIDEILAINRSASPSFLARFTDVQLDEYLAHLHVLSTPRLRGSAERYEKYFRNCPAIQSPRPQWRQTSGHVEDVVADEDDLDEGETDEQAVNDEAFLDYAEVDLQPAERQQLYVDVNNLPEDEADEVPDEEFGEDLPEPLTVSPSAGAEQPDLPDLPDLPELAEPEPPGTPDEDPEHAPAQPEPVTAAAGEAGPLFTASEEDSEAWLY